MFKLKLIGVVILLGLFGGAWIYFTGNYSDGFRAGTVMKLSRKGYIFKTYEGQLNLGMILNQDPSHQVSVNNIWEFSVRSKDRAVVDSLEKAMTTGQRVRLHYEEKYQALPWMGETRYFIYKVETAPLSIP
jgi:hypothetical protein